jgi:hypothetical protein
LLVNGQPFEVVSREVREGGGKASVVYGCQGLADKGELMVGPGPVSPVVNIEWHGKANIVRLSEADVEVFEEP